MLSVFPQFLFALLILIIWARASSVCKKRRSECHPDESRECNQSTGDANATATIAREAASSHKREAIAKSSSELLVPVKGLMTSVYVEDCDDKEIDVRTQQLHLASVVIVFAITVTNMFITGLGFEPAGSAQAKQES